MIGFRSLSVVAACALATTLSLAGPASAEVVSGKASYYDLAGTGACGTPIDAATEDLVAAPASLWTTPNPNEDPICEKSIRVTYNGTTITVPVKDKCPSCDSTHIDLSKAAFQKLDDPSVGVLQVEWELV